MTALNVCLFVSSVILVTISPFSKVHCQGDQALRESSFYSPIFDRYSVRYLDRVVSAPLFNEDTLSQSDMILRGPPSPEVDAAWDQLTDVGIIVISRSEVERLGKDPDLAVRAPFDMGFPRDSYLGQIDGQHALHCLNAVRKYGYSEYYFPNRTKSDYLHSSNKETIYEAHLTHCLHILLQTLTCKPSFDVITHNWVDTQNFPFPDFAINKKCVDHQQLRHWETKNRLSEEQWVEMSQRGPEADETTLPLPEKMYEWSLRAEMTDTGGHENHH